MNANKTEKNAGFSLFVFIRVHSWPKKSLVAVGMFVVGVLLLVHSYRDGAAGFRNRAAYVLELHGGVGDRESRLEHSVEAAQDRVAGRGRDVFDQHVAAQRVSAGTQAPDVQVVNVEHALNGSHG